MHVGILLSPILLPCLIPLHLTPTPQRVLICTQGMIQLDGIGSARVLTGFVCLDVAKTLSGVSSMPDGFTLYIEVNSQAGLAWLLERVCSAIDVAGRVRSANSAARAVRAPTPRQRVTACLRTQITKNDEVWPCLACLKRHRVIRSVRHSQYLSHGHHK